MISPGDVVVFNDYFESSPEQEKIGTAITVEVWRDSGAPDRNVGVRVQVMWSDGSLTWVEEDDLALYYED